jgi:hypothetical protein
MKRSIFIAIALVALATLLFVSGPVNAVHAQSPADREDIQGFCNDNNDFGMSHGDCVSVAETNINALAGSGNTDGVTICKILENVFGPFPMGDCVNRFAKY